MKLSEFSVNRPVTTVMATLSVVILGFVSVGRIPLESFPSISSSGITVTATYPSSSPEEVEREITLPLESSLATLSNIDQISSTSSGNSASVRVDFNVGTDMDLATMEVRDRVDQVRGLLPDEVTRVQIWRWQSDQRPILSASMAWRGEGDRLLDIARKVIEPRLLRLEGVVNVGIEGIEEKQLIVELDQEHLEAHDVSLPYLANQVRGNNVNISLGRVDDGGHRYLVRALGEYTTTEQIGAQPLQGRDLLLRDLGSVVFDYPEKKNYERLNGIDAVSVEVYKASNATVVNVAQAARLALEKIEAEYGDQLEIEIVRDRSTDVLREVNNLANSALLGALLAVGIIFIFLRNIRSTLVIAMAIPVSVFCVFTGMYVAREFFGSSITLNMVSMMGLVLAVGMLVDPAVVALESIFRKREEDGLDARQASLEGSQEIGMAVVASSLTTICVFIPFFFLSTSGMTRWMGDAGITICLAIAVSMGVALSVIPLATSRLFKAGFQRFDPFIKGAMGIALTVLAVWLFFRVGGLAWFNLWLKQIGASIAAMTWSTALVLGIVCLLIFALARYGRRRSMRQSYIGLLNWTLDHRLMTLVATVALLSTGIYLFQQIPQQGIPRTPDRRVDITVEMERSYSLEEVKALFTNMEQLVLAKGKDLDVESVSSRFRQRGGSLTVRLVDADEGHLSTAAAGRSVMGMLPKKVGVNYKMGRQRSWMGNVLGVEVLLKGRDPSVLAVLAEEVQAKLARLPGVQDVDTSLEDGEEEIQVQIDREQTLSYGLAARDVATSISTALGTRRTSTYKTQDREIDLVLQLQEADRATMDQLKNNAFEGRDGNRVQLGTLADFRIKQGPQELKREDRQLNLTVFANTSNRREAFQLMGPVRQMMGAMTLPIGYSWSLGGQARWVQQETGDNYFIMVFAVLLIYLIMASLFESLIHPFTIILAIPFSLIGVSLGLYLFDIPLDANGMLGLLILFGIVVNNGIVLIDHINHFRREGMPRRQAILRGGQNRMRPILMTAFTTVLNLMPLVLPMLYGNAEGFSQRWGPVGLVVVCGLISSTVLTLVLAPTLYSLLDDLGLWMRRVAHAAKVQRA
jgi:HAE1 family hydrophobic/amphiphilic exporter-1